MAIKAGRVGVRPDQVDVHGRLVPTDWLIEKIREILNTESAEIHANQTARLELERLALDKPVVTIEPVESVETKTVKRTSRKKVTT